MYNGIVIVTLRPKYSKLFQLTSMDPFWRKNIAAISNNRSQLIYVGIFRLSSIYSYLWF